MKHAWVYQYKNYSKARKNRKWWKEYRMMDHFVLTTDLDAGNHVCAQHEAVVPFSNDCIWIKCLSVG